MTKPFLFLTLLILGSNSLGQNIDAYFCPLVEDLKLLSKDGVETCDVALKMNFKVHATLLLTCSCLAQLVQIDGLVISLKVINHVEHHKHIPTNILGLSMVGIGCEINLTFKGYYISPTLRKFHHQNYFLLTYDHPPNTVPGSF